MIKIKIVPDGDPNAEGDWMSLPEGVELGKSWSEHEKAAKGFIPKGFHLVSVSPVKEFEPLGVGNQAGYIA